VNVVDVGYGEDEENVKKTKGVRRSTGLSKQRCLLPFIAIREWKMGKTMTRVTKGKGKENAGRASSFCCYQKQR
jgi:hypothetical protein